MVWDSEELKSRRVEHPLVLSKQGVLSARPVQEGMYLVQHQDST